MWTFQAILYITQSIYLLVCISVMLCEFVIFLYMYLKLCERVMVWWQMCECVWVDVERLCAAFYVYLCNKRELLFGYDTDKVFNHIFSIIICFIDKEWLICSLENRQRKQQFCYNSFLNYLNIRKNVYSKGSNSIWIDVCITLICLIAYVEDNLVARH